MEKRKKKKILNNLLLVTMVTSLLFSNQSLTLAAEKQINQSASQQVEKKALKDVQKHWAKEYILTLVTRGSVEGFTDGTFRPEDKVTKEQFVKMLVASMGYDQKKFPDSHFVDVPPTRWSYPYVEVAVKQGIIVPAEEGRTFEPTKFITRQEVAVMTARALSLLGDVSKLQFKDKNSITFHPELVGAAVSKGIVSGFEGNVFKPNDTATRAQVTKMIVAGLKATEEQPVVRKEAKNKIEYKPEVDDLGPIGKDIQFEENSKTVIIESNKDAVSKLKRGSIFVIQPSQEFPSGLARKVISVTTQGSNTVLETEQPKILEVINSIDVSQETGITKEALENAQFPEGVSVRLEAATTAYEKPHTVRSIHYDSSIVDINTHRQQMDSLVFDFGSFDISKYMKEKKMGDFGVSQAGSITLNGAFKLKDPTIFADVHLDYTKHDIYTTFTFMPEATLTLNAVGTTHVRDRAYDKQFEKKIPFGTIPVPIGTTGLVANLELYLVVYVNAEGKLEVALDGYVKEGIDFVGEFDGPFDYVSQFKPIDYKRVEPKLKELSGSAEVKVGIEPTLGLSVLKLDDFLQLNVFLGGKANGEAFWSPPIRCAQATFSPMVEAGYALDLAVYEDAGTFFEASLFDAKWRDCNYKGLKVAPESIKLTQENDNQPLEVRAIMTDGTEEDVTGNKGLRYELSKELVPLMAVEDNTAQLFHGATNSAKGTIQVVLFDTVAPVNVQIGSDWNGEWTRTVQHNESKLIIKNAKEKYFDFEIYASYGARSGELSGKANINGSKAAYRDDEGLGCELNFQNNGNKISVTETEGCLFYAGMGVTFAGDYANGSPVSKTKDLVDLKILTKEQDAQFRKVIGKDYEKFVYNIMVRAEHEDLDGFSANVVVGWVTSLATIMESILMYNPDNGLYWAAFIDSDEKVIKYYTNDVNYKSKLPKTIEDWKKGVTKLPVKYMSK